MTRLFCGLPLGLEAGEALLERVRADLGAAAEHVRLPRPENLHLTLHFLGEVDEQAVPGLVEALASELRGLPGPRARLVRPGAFPSRGRERVLWVAPREEEGTEGRLAELHERTLRAARRVGLLGEARDAEPWRPHVTVGRLRERTSGGGVPAEFYEREHDVPFEPPAALLVESRLRPGGPRYRERGRFPWNPPSPK